ncbi:hypothetical protein DV738_g3928, partial [Chaetothyriales sp. CBS 135597]
MTSKALVNFWSTDLTRQCLLSYLAPCDLKVLRLTCLDFALDVAPELFVQLDLDFTPNIFSRHARMVALERIGRYVKTLSFRLEHSSTTFLPPLIAPDTLDEVTFLYEPHVVCGRPASSSSASSGSRYGDDEISDLLVKHYPPLFHAATNITAFARAILALPNLKAVKISCPNQSPGQRYRKSVVDYALASLRIALEQVNPPALESLTLDPIHPGALQHLRPLSSFGASPASTRVWRRIKRLTIRMDSFEYGRDMPSDHLKFLHTYLETFVSLEHLDFTWLGSRGPCPLSLDTEPSTCRPRCLECSNTCPKTAAVPSCKPIKFRHLKSMHVRNAILDASQVASFIVLHRKVLHEFSFDECRLRSGTWDDALSPLNHLARNKDRKRAQEEVIMDVPLVLSPDEKPATDLVVVSQLWDDNQGKPTRQDRLKKLATSIVPSAILAFLFSNPHSRQILNPNTLFTRDGGAARPPAPLSIPLQDLSRPPDDGQDEQNEQDDGAAGMLHPRHGRTRSLLSRASRTSTSSYYRLDDDEPLAGHQRLTPIINSYADRDSRGEPPLDDIHDFTQPSVGLGLGFNAQHLKGAPHHDAGREASTTPPPPPVNTFDFAQPPVGLALDFNASSSTAPAPSTPQFRSHQPTIIMTQANDSDEYEGNLLYALPESDTTPLTGKQHPSKSSASTNQGQRHDRPPRRSTIHSAEPSPFSTERGREPMARLGDDLATLEAGAGGRRRKSSAASDSARLEPGDRDARSSRSLSPSPSPMARANSIFREMSQRVVNLSNDTDVVERTPRRKSTVRQARGRKGTTVSAPTDEPEEGVPSDLESAPRPSSQTEKRPSTQEERPAGPEAPAAFLPTATYPNPLRGRSWGIFGPENPVRRFCCELLIHPATEPIILALIVIHTVLLAVNAGTDAVYHRTNTQLWGSSRFDYAILAIFIVYTLELIARTIVSGFVSNPYEYSTLDRSIGLKRAIIQKGQTLFAPHSQNRIRSPSPSPAPDGGVAFQPSVVRAFTGLPDPDDPGHGKHKQRLRLARRALLRHSFNRLDFVAVVSYWISFAMILTRYEANKHVYIFKMLSCLRILRLLGLTTGTSIILRSLKKAAPLLVHVSFLICFFWLLFGIIGVQSFKSSLRRTCVWVGNDGSGQNYSLNVAPDNIQFCGGYLDALTGEALPWLKSDGRNGTKTPKGYFCPQGSLCVESGNGPYNGTVSFDNIGQSLELVFVIMSSNTFSDLLYYLTESDYLASALFFAAGIVVLTLWMMNLLVAVITSSFQLIREESRQSAFQAEDIEEPDADDDIQVKKNTLKRFYDKTYYFWIAVIAFGLVMQCLRSATMSSSREKAITNAETVVTFVLLLEIIFRFMCDWRAFFRSKRNWTDLTLAVITTVMQIPVIHDSGQPYAWLSAFQIARIYRVVLAVRVTRELLMVVFRNIAGLVNLILFVALFTFFAAILASQLFRGEFPPTDPGGDENFIQFFDIWNSFIGMYQVLSSENWTGIMYNATQYELMWHTSWLSALFFILWFIISNFITLNMFIAVIQESFEVSEDEKRLQQVKMFLRQKELTDSAAANLSLASIFRLGREHDRHRDALEYGHTAMEQLLKDAVVKDFLDENEQGLKRRTTTIPLTQQPATDGKLGFLTRWRSKLLGNKQESDPNPFYTPTTVARANEEFDPRAMAKQVVASTDNRRRAQRQYLIRHPRYNVSLHIFKVNNPVRWVCQKIVGPGRGAERVEGASPNKTVWYTYSAVTYAAIVAMVVLACVTTPLYQREYYKTHEQGLNNWFVWVDLGFAIFFTIEALIKMIADGFFFTPHAYYRSVWGFIDGVVLFTLWINVLTAMFNESGISRAVGAFKALRALRLLHISDTARNTFHSVIIVGFYKILAAAFVSMSLLVPFAILGLNLFNGKLQECNDGDFAYSSLSNCVGEYNSTPFNWPVLAPRMVANPYYSFDDFGSALFILFQIVSQEGWIDVMTSAVSITGRGLQPQNYASQGNAVYFIIFNLLGSVFVLTLFISVFMRNYTEQTGVAFLTADQRSWLELRKLLKQITPSKRSFTENFSSWRRRCYDMSVKKRGRWHRFITGLLLAHLCLLIAEFYPEPEWWRRMREHLFLAFTLVFFANVLIRIIGLSWQRFQRSAWDLYSVMAVSGALATSILSLALPDTRAVYQLQYLFLDSLVLLLIPRNNELDQLFKTAAASLPLIGNLMATWFVLFLVFAIALTQTFGLTRFGANESVNLNFRDVPKALILLFRTSVGEGWNQIMEDFATIQPPFCVSDSNFFNSDCGSESWARALFIAWNIISMYIFVSLFVSLIFESFSYVYQRSSGLSVVTRDEIRRFKQAWAEFDPKGTGYISKERFPRLLGELSGIFQMRIYEGDFTVKNLIEDCTPTAGEESGVNGRRRIVDGIDLDKLAERIRQIPVDEIRKRRQRMEVFYQEMLISADPDRGISFTSCLMILAHYNVIEDSRSLRLEEFLRRRARLQRVHETMRRNVVTGFFDMMYWSRRFRNAVEQRRNSRTTVPAQLAVPAIYIEDPDEEGASVEPADFTGSRPGFSPTTATRTPTPTLPKIDTSLALNESPLPTPRASYDGSPSVSPTVSSRRGSQSPSWAGRSPSLAPTLGHSRRTSSTDALDTQGVVESFDTSAWGESIKRSLTTKRRPSDR